MNKFLEENPESEDYDVIYATDEEGNAFKPVYFSPTAGYFYDNEFRTKNDIDEFNDEWPNEGLKENTVCIN